MLTILIYSAAGLLSAAIGAVTLIWGSRSFAYRIFAVGMFLFSLEQIALGFGFQTASPSEVIEWYWLGSIITALLPGTWLLFSLSFARANYRGFVAKWKWIILVVFVVPLTLTLGFKSSFYLSSTAFDNESGWLIQMGKAGYIYQLFLLLSAILILANLERTFRAFKGSMRWQVKFMVLAVFAVFATRIYSASQSLLYSYINTSLDILSSGSLLIADFLIIVWFFRTRFSALDVYVSQTALYNSLAVLIGGVYLLAVGIVSGLISSFNVFSSFPLEVLFVFFSILVLALLLLSDELRQKFKYYINLHLRRPQYDYRREWTSYTQRTLSLFDVKEQCVAVAKMVSDTFGIPSVSIWLLDDPHQKVYLGGSTVFSVTQERTLQSASREILDFLQYISKQDMPVDLSEWKMEIEEEKHAAVLSELAEQRSRYCAPLNTAGEVIGFMALSERLNGKPFSLEDFDLLKTISDQTAASIISLKLAERLRVSKQMEMFRTLSTFFVHDLKNLAATLSLTLQNLPLHFDNPEFREDTLKVIEQSVAKINGMCTKLSGANQNLELNCGETDINELVEATLCDLRGCANGSLVTDLQPLPKLSIDSDQMKKVLTNLILNAKEASGNAGTVKIETCQNDDSILLSVKDNGCGISQDFLEKSLFEPFKTTKKKGLGIGLFQSKMIVEAHRGRIEVESKEGVGTTFRVVLPVER